MKFSNNLFIAVLLLLYYSCGNPKPNKPGLEVVFEESTHQIIAAEKQTTKEVIVTAEKKVRSLLSFLPKDIKVMVQIVDWDLNAVGGVTGRTESNSPAIVAIQISNTFPGGISAAIDRGLASTIFHEFHHLSRGWAIRDNRFERGIAIAMVNEGLAEVFAEEYTGAIFKENHVPESANAEDWITEILGLPKSADYQKWMFEHPDGRTSIGYRAGNYLIRYAMSNSKKDILELSNLTPDEILKHAGY